MRKFKSAAHEVANTVGVTLRKGTWRHDTWYGYACDERGMRVRDIVTQAGWTLVSERKMEWGYKGDNVEQRFEHADGSAYVATRMGTWGELLAPGATSGYPTLK